MVFFLVEQQRIRKDGPPEGDVIPRQFSNWRGNPPLKKEIATPACALVRNDSELKTPRRGVLFFGGQQGFERTARLKGMSFRASSQTGVGIPP